MVYRYTSTLTYTPIIIMTFRRTQIEADTDIYDRVQHLKSKSISC